MIERLFKGRERRQKRQIGILLERGVDLFFGLPHHDKRYRADPSWGEVEPRRIRSLPAVDRKFLLKDGGGQGDKVKILVGFDGPDCWIGIEFAGRRVRYLDENPVLKVFHEEAGEKKYSRKERGSWDGFERAVKIGEALLVSIEN